MFLFAIMFVAGLLTVAGRYVFGQWYNHFSLYTAIWGGALALFEMRLINYYPLEVHTWTVIFAGSFSFLIGSLTVWAYRLSQGKSVYPRSSAFLIEAYSSPEWYRLIERVLWWLNLVTFLTVMQHWYAMIKIAGGLVQVFMFSNILYSYRVEWGIPGAIPYLKSLTLMGAVLGGAMTALSGRVRLVAIAPIVIIFLGEIVAVGRSLLVQGGIFFLCGYFTFRTHIARNSKTIRPMGRGRMLLSIAIVGAVILGSMEFIRSNRGGEEIYRGSTASLNTFHGKMFISPSIYLYLSSNFGILNQYLKQDVEHVPWGGNTFGSVYHVLEKLGSTTHVGAYQRFYKTPAMTNLGTYLREVHEDFGFVGVLTYPYLLGLLASLVWFRLVDRFSAFMLIILGCVLDMVVMGLFVIVTRGGDLLVVAVVAVGVGWILDGEAREIGRQSWSISRLRRPMPREQQQSEIRSGVGM